MSTQLAIPSRKPTRTNPHGEINQDNNHESNAENSRAPLFIIDAFDVAAFADLVHAPDIQEQAVDECDGCEDGEGPC